MEFNIPNMATNTWESSNGSMNSEGVADSASLRVLIPTHMRVLTDLSLSEEKESYQSGAFCSPSAPYLIIAFRTRVVQTYMSLTI